MITVEDIYKMVGKAHVSIASLQLRHNVYPAVYCWSGKQEVALVPFDTRRVEVFKIESSLVPKPLGTFSETAQSVDELADYIEKALVALHAQYHKEEPKERSPFELRVERRGNGDCELVLYQYPIGYQNAKRDILKVASLACDKTNVIFPSIMQGLIQAGHKATDIALRAGQSFDLDEEAGARIALLLMVVAPLSRADRVDEAEQRLYNMSSEEVYYWYSKCVHEDIKTRARKALRILLANE